jgi:hypothetical protein
MLPSTAIVTPENFKYYRYFADIERDLVQNSIDTVLVMFYGVLTYLWGMMDNPIKDAKRLECFNLLVAWHMASNYPEYLIGMMSNPLLPIEEKKIKSIKLKFHKLVRQENGLDMLQSNPFGVQALTMIMAAPETFIWR